MTERSYAADTEASFVDGVPAGPIEEESQQDLFAVKLEEEGTELAKWRRKLRRCGCCVKVVAALAMGCAAWHLVGPRPPHPPKHWRGPHGRDGWRRDDWQHQKHGDEGEWGRHLQRMDEDDF
jgi:hypothetical protein